MTDTTEYKSVDTDVRIAVSDSIYAKYIKRLMDIVLSFLAMVVLSPIILILMIVGAVVMRGNPFFVQPRPGKKDKNGNEKIFNLIKFRSMDNRRDKDGNLLPDSVRLNKYGRFLRGTSIDELPELFNIFLGQMSVVGPRPQLVRDMVFMTERQRQRHDVRPGLTGLAQVSGRNALDWVRKIECDLNYIEKITFWGDVKIIFITARKIIIRKSDENAEVEIVDDFGDYLLKSGTVSNDEYNGLQEEAKRILEKV